MTDRPKILVFSGSNRKASVNRKLAVCAATLLREAGADVTPLDLADYPMPLYDGDLEDAEGLPENAAKLQRLFTDHDGFFIAAPEYNSSITPLLKNTIDWLTRPGAENVAPLAGKVAGLGAASPGGLGGLRGLVVVRMLLSNLAVHVIPQQVAVGGAHEAFGEDGMLRDDRTRKMLGGVVTALVHTAGRLSGH